MRNKPFFRIIVGIVSLSLFACLTAIGVLIYYGHGLPNRLDLMSTYRPSIVSTVYDAHGTPIGEFYHQRRIVVPLEQIPVHIIQAFLAAEDARFFKHRGVDILAVFRAFISNLRKGEIREGASTLTQQLVRGFFLTQERTLERKIREAILAYRVEKNHTKEEILYLYLNQVYFGHGNYGIEAASRDYFGKGVESINLAEAALLAGLPRSPSRNSPYRDFFSAIERQRYVLRRMHKERFITEATHDEALITPIRLTPAPLLNSQIAPHFLEHVRQVIGERYGFNPLLQGGLRIYTSLDLSLQMAAQQAAREGLDEIRLRLKRKTNAASQGEVEGALLALDPHTGMVRALVGGYDFSVSQYNRALQAKRQSGSAFKPIIYSAALEGGLSQLTIIPDGPVSFKMAAGKYWRPQNYQDRFFGPVTLRSALAHSLNSVSVRLVERMGPEKVIRQARKLGIESPLDKNLSLALGTSSVSLLEMVRAYAVFANGGKRVEPLFITKVTDRDGRILEENVPEPKQVLSPEVSYVLTDMLKNVIQSGTGRTAATFGGPIAGKTGTTSEFRDGWFIGYTPNLIAGVWVGYDNFQPLGDRETGGRTALPIWLSFMKAGGQDKKTDDFPVPQGVGWLDVNLKGDGYPLPVFESVPVARIPFAIGSKPLIQPLPSKEVKESPLPTSVGGEREESERPPDLAQPG
ncbi:MAG TPA: penicillin-binding protein 1A [Candidatus Binatia bacterium]|nr:penicillin-binding protein 1A [Candidatus Binatia bacterium]